MLVQDRTEPECQINIDVPVIIWFPVLFLINPFLLYPDLTQPLPDLPTPSTSTNFTQPQRTSLNFMEHLPTSHFLTLPVIHLISSTSHSLTNLTQSHQLAFWYCLLIIYYTLCGPTSTNLILLYLTTINSNWPQLISIAAGRNKTDLTLSASTLPSNIWALFN